MAAAMCLWRNIRSSVLLYVIYASVCSAIESFGDSSDGSSYFASSVLKWLHVGSLRRVGNRNGRGHDLWVPNGNLTTAPQYFDGLPHFISGAKTERHEHISYKVQMMHRPEVDLAASYMRSSDLYLEWGSGGSTRNFPPLVRKAYSIEHDCEWLDYLRRELNESDTDYSNLETLCVGVQRGYNGWGTISSFEHGDYRTFKSYVDAVDSLGVDTFDVIFVDGRARMACALKSLQYMSNDSVLFIHDFYTRNMQYGGVLEYFEEVARVLAFPNTNGAMGPIDEPQGLVVLRRRADAPAFLSSEQIIAKYDDTDWRYPFPEPLNKFSGIFKYYVLNSIRPSLWKRARNPETLVQYIRLDMLRFAIVSIAVLSLLRRWNRHFAIRHDDRILNSNKSAGEECEEMAVTSSHAADRYGPVTGTAFVISREDYVSPSRPTFIDTPATASAAARRNSSISKFPK